MTEMLMRDFRLFHRVDGDIPWKEPRRAYQGDAGYDLFSPLDFQLGPGETRKCRTNVRVDLPPGWFAIVSERSSQGMAGLTSFGNIVDEGYEGEVHVMLHNASKSLVIVHRDEKLGQLVLVPRFVDPREHLLPVRGDKGHGSSGRV